MTLFELCLVLVLLVVIGSLAAPLVEGSFASLRLRRGTDQVLAAWTAARTKAIETGTVLEFRFASQSGNYRIEPWQSGVLLVAEGEPQSQRLESLVDPTTSGTAWYYEAVLPENILFSGGQRQAIDPVTGLTAPQEVATEMEDWSLPVRFLPDGTTTAASVVLENEQGLLQRATLRPLTGVGRASEPFTPGEAGLKGQ